MRKHGLFWLWVAVAVLLLDFVTKQMAVRYLEIYTPFKVTAFFNLTLAYNKGAAFSFLDKASGWQTWLFGSLAVAVSVGIIIWLKLLSAQQRWLCIALNMILGGALGNLWDRVHYGHVIDFLEFHAAHLYWPAFNIADSAICIGAVMILLDAMFFKKSQRSGSR